MKAFLAFLIEFSAFLFVTATVDNPFNFIALLRATSGNQTKDCAAVLIPHNNVVAASHCVFFDKDVEHNVTINICFNSEEVVTEINDEDCRTVTYLYKAKQDFGTLNKDNDTDLRVVAIEGIAFFEVSKGKKFKVDDMTLPIIDPYAQVIDLETMLGFVLTINGNILN